MLLCADKGEEIHNGSKDNGVGHNGPNHLPKMDEL